MVPACFDPYGFWTTSATEAGQLPLLVQSLSFHMSYGSWGLNHSGAHSSFVAEVVQNPYGSKQAGTMVGVSHHYFSTFSLLSLSRS